jgi:hypothetical protein
MNQNQSQLQYDGEFLHNVCLSIKFMEDVTDILSEYFYPNKNDAYNGEWEITSNERGYRLYFYDFDKLKNTMYFQNALSINCCHKCLIEDIDKTFKGASYKIVLHCIFDTDSDDTDYDTDE